MSGGKRRSLPPDSPLALHGFGHCKQLPSGVGSAPVVRDTRRGITHQGSGVKRRWLPPASPPTPPESGNCQE
ncbi:MAG: hypothetical protein ACFCBU_09085, partial [Cyanophyceae cyanobacterium]